MRSTDTAGGSRPKLYIIHDFMGSSSCSTDGFSHHLGITQSGCDVMLSLPFNSPWAEKFSPVGGFYYFSRSLSGFTERIIRSGE